MTHLFVLFHIFFFNSNPYAEDDEENGDEDGADVEEEDCKEETEERRRPRQGKAINYGFPLLTYEVYRRLARHSPRAEANIVKACNTMQWSRYHKIPYHT